MALCCINRHPTSVRMEMNYNYAALFDITKLDIPFWVEFDAFFHVIYGVGDGVMGSLKIPFLGTMESILKREYRLITPTK